MAADGNRDPVPEAFLEPRDRVLPSENRTPDAYTNNLTPDACKDESAVAAQPGDEGKNPTLQSSTNGVNTKKRIVDPTPNARNDSHLSNVVRESCADEPSSKRRKEDIREELKGTPPLANGGEPSGDSTMAFGELGNEIIAEHKTQVDVNGGPAENNPRTEYRRAMGNHLERPQRNDSSESIVNGENRNFTLFPGDEKFSTLSPEVQNALRALFTEGVCDPADIDTRSVEFLSGLPDKIALTAIDDIHHRDFSTIRNRPAFIMSIFKRVANPQRDAVGGPAPFVGSVQPYSSGFSRSIPRPPPRGMRQLPPEPTYVRPSGPRASEHNPDVFRQPAAPPPPHPPAATVPPEALAHLPTAVGEGLQQVFASGVCHPSEFDDRAMEILVALKEPEAVRALEEFASVEPGRVRKPSAFWMGLARKYKGLGASGVSGPQNLNSPSSRGYGNQYGYESYDRRSAADEHAYVSGHRQRHYSSQIDSLSASRGPVALNRTPEFRHALAADRLQRIFSETWLSPNDLDDRAIDAIKRMSESEEMNVVDEILRTDPSRVRNISAYIMGLYRKYAAEGLSLSARDNEVEVDTDILDPLVREKFHALISSGTLPNGGLDGRAMFALKSMPQHEALASLDELARSEPGRVRNVSAYFMGLARSRSRH